MAYYKASFPGTGRMLQRPWLQPPCLDAANELKGLAEGVSPVGDPLEDKHPGLYRASFEVLPIFKSVRFKGRPTTQ